MKKILLGLFILAALSIVCTLYCCLVVDLVVFLFNLVISSPSIIAGLVILVLLFWAYNVNKGS